MEAPGGRAVLQFEGHPAVLTLVRFDVAPQPEPEPDYVPESEPEEEEPDEVPEEDEDVEVVLDEDADGLVAAEMIVVSDDDEADDEEPMDDGFLEIEGDGDVTDDDMLG